MNHLRLIAACLVFVVQPAFAQNSSPPAASRPASTPPPKFPVAAFAERSGFEEIALSPDGKLIVVKVVGPDGKGNIAFLDAATKRPIQRYVLPVKNQLEWLRWAGNRRVLMSFSVLDRLLGEEVRITRLFVIDLDTGQFTMVGRKEMGLSGDDLVYTDPAGQYVLLTIQRNIFEYPTVWRFPLDGTAEKNGKLVQDSRIDVWDWFADSRGVIRMGIQTSDSQAFKVLYRSSEKDDFKTIGKIRYDSADSDFLDVVGINNDSDEGLILKEDENGKVVLRKYNYITRTAGETLYAAPGNWDVDDVSLDDNFKPVAAYYTDDRERVNWFDPGMKSLYERFNRALKGKDVLVTSRAHDNSRMVVWAGGENDPGAYYIFDAAKSNIDMFFAEKVGLDPEQLPSPKPVSYAARDGTQIHAYLTLPLGRPGKNLPLIILPHGGPYGVRDKLAFDDEVQFLANRGYAVLQPNYRGSDGYGRSFSELGDGQIGRKMQDDLDDGMDWAVAQGYVDPKRVCVVGSSYGGYAALWAAIRNPERYRCAASFAGVTDWKSQLTYDSQFFSHTNDKKWKARVRGEGGKFDMAAVSPVQQVAQLARPVLLAHGEDDTTVPFKQFKLMRDAAAKAGKPLELLTFEDEGHGFEKAEDEAKWLGTLEAFLNRHNPAD